jgi:hypothetical protein
MALLADKLDAIRLPGLLTFALLADRTIYLICETLGRTTNPVMIATIIATNLLANFRRGEHQSCFRRPSTERTYHDTASQD